MVKKTRKFFNPIITKLCSGQRPFLKVEKSKYRSTLSQTSFNNQLMIMQEGPKLDDFNPSEAVNHRSTTWGIKHQICRIKFEILFCILIFCSKENTVQGFIYNIQQIK
jgi:hypothetical protein